MHSYLPNRLPEELRPLTRFLPVDGLDFGRRAKALSKLLEQPLQDAQQILARAYGFAHLHELHQALKSDRLPGPFDDQLPAMLGWGSTDGASRVRFHRHTRLMRFILEWATTQGYRAYENRDMLACDLGLFSTPTALRVATRTVKEFVASGLGITTEGFPFGFNGALHTRYVIYDMEFAENAFDEVSAAGVLRQHAVIPFDPREQLRILRRFRAPRLFVEMSKESVPSAGDDVSESFGIKLRTNPRELDFDALLQSPFNSEIEDHVKSVYKKAADLDWVGREPASEQLRAAILLPSDENIQACEFLETLSNFRELVRNWRHSLRLQMALALTSEWIHEYREDLGRPIVLSSGSGDHAMFQVLRPQYVGTAIRRWDLSAVLLRMSASTGTWSVDAALTGDYVVPFTEDRWSSHYDVQMYLDDVGDGELYQAWGLLEELYLPRAGYRNYGDWLGADNGRALANVTFWTAPGADRATISAILFDAFVTTYNGGHTSTWDTSWREWVRPQDAASDEDDYEAEACLPPIGVVFVAEYGTGVLGYSIWDGEAEHATCHLVQLNGKRLGRQARTTRQSGATTKQEGLALANLKAVQTVGADFVFYDPHGPAEGAE